MKAAERIHKYGLKKYLMSCRKIKMTQAIVEKYQSEYGTDIPLDKVVRYRQSVWYIEMEREDEVWRGNGVSYLHVIMNDERDMEEAFRVAQTQAGESGWVLTFAEKLGYKKPIYHPEGHWEEKAAVVKETVGGKAKIETQAEVVTESIQSRRASIAKALRDAGYSAVETAKALMDVT